MRQPFEELFESEAIFKQIVESIDTGVWIENMRGEIWYVNPQLAKILGYTCASLLEMRITEDLIPASERYMREKLTHDRLPSERHTEQLRMVRSDGRIIIVNISSGPILTGKGEQVGVISTATDVTELNRQLEVSAFMTEATALLASSLDYKTTLSSLAALAVPRICDWCAIDMAGPHGELERVALTHSDPKKIELSLRFQQEFPLKPDAITGAFEVMRSGKSELMTYMSDEMLEINFPNKRQKEMILELGIRSYMIVALKARGTNLGTLTLVASNEGTRYGEWDLGVAEELASHAALAIDNAHLYTQAQLELTERTLTEEKIRHQALHDSLTQLPNRIFLHEQLSQACRRAEKSNKSCGILFMDLDRFKLINDSLGHHAGDELLKAVAERLLECIGIGDTVARFGGDEFVIVTSDADDYKQIIASAKKIFASLEKPLNVLGQEIYVNTTIGISVFPSDSKDIETLVKYADNALYCAKDLGRNTYCLYSTQEGNNSGKRLALETDLRNALHQQQFELYYQPIYNIKQNQVIGAEALIRWNHPVRGVLLPNSFLSYAEDIGIIHSLGQWVLEEACQQLVRWSSTELKDLNIAVNISPLQFFRTDFVDQFKETLSRAKIDPSHLSLELTERLAMQDIEAVVVRLHQLKALGVGIAIDDFGIGHSSLNYLKLLPIDTLKIDKSFVQSSPTSPADEAIVSAVSMLARRLKMRVVAEGVEEPDQFAFLQQNDACDEIQGFAVSIPLSSTEFEDYYAQKPLYPIDAQQ